MSINLNLSDGRVKFDLVQTPTEVTRACKPELNNRQFTRDKYVEYVLAQGFDYAEDLVADLDQFLKEHPRARFYAI